MQQAPQLLRRQVAFAWRGDRRTLTLGFLVAVIIEIAVYGVLLLNADNLTTSKDWVTHTHIVLEKLHDVLSDLDDAVLSEQALLLTGNANSSERLSAAEQAAQQDMAEVRQLTADNPTQQHNLGLLTPQITSWLGSLQQTVRNTTGVQGLDAIRQQIGAMEDEENRLLLVRDQQANTSTQVAAPALVSAGLLSVGLFILMAIGRDNAERKRVQKELKRSEERYRLLVEHIEDYAIYTIDPGGHISTWNPSIQRLKGYSESEILGQPISRFFPPEDVQAGKPQRLLETAASQGWAEDAGWRVRKDGSRFWAKVIIIALHNLDGSLYGFTKITRDVTERIQAQERIEKLNRIYRVLSDINQAIIHIRQMPLLFDAACSLAVKEGGFRMAWIGLVDRTSDQLNIVSRSGIIGDFLDKFGADLNSSVRGPSPARSILTTGVHLVCNDIEHDPRVAPWREDALRQGYQAVASFPLSIAGKVYGIFSLYAGEVGFFDDDELALLDELALDISFAIEFAEQDELRQQAQAGLQRYAKRLEILHDIDTGIIEASSIREVLETTLGHIRRLFDCQQAAVILFDYTSNEFLYFAVDMNALAEPTNGVRYPIPPGFLEEFGTSPVTVIDDIQLLADPGPGYQRLIEAGMRSSLRALLIERGSPIGALGLSTDIPGFFTAEHHELAATVASQIAIAIRQLRLSEQLTQRTADLEHNFVELKQAESALPRYTQRLEILHDIDTAIINATSIENVIEATLRNIRRLIPCQRAHVAVIDQTLTEGLYFALVLDGETELRAGTRVPLTPAIFAGFDDTHMRVVDDFRPQQEDFPQIRQFVSEGLVSSLQVLLMVKEQPIGALSLWATTSGFFTTEHQEIAAQVASQLAVAIQQLRLSEALAQRATELEQSIAEIKRTQEEHRQSDARYRRILETLQEGVWLTDGAARTTFANQAMADILGYSTTELLDIPPLQLIHNAPGEPTESRIERRQQGLSEQYDLQLRSKDGGVVWALVNASPILDDEGRYTGSAVTLADITERKQHETEMARKNRDLETLLYITSHDLREPLRAIRNFSQMVNDRYRDALDAKGQDFLTRIARAGDRMDRLIEDILQLSRAQRKIAPADHLSGEALVAEALKPLDAKILATNAEITIHSPLPTLVVDRFWAGQAIFNLVANSLKFVEPGERPQVEISAYSPPEDSPDGAGLVVRDRGIGLESEQVERIFGLFQRAVGRDIEGTGAGLAIVREIAERHGGRAWAQPRADRGAEFFITFGRNI